jgi:geranylgeranyl reductase family protein
MAARLLAQLGAHVLLLDKARFPRDKPCGGGVTLQAASEAGLDLSPVIERTVNEVHVSFRERKAFVRNSSDALSYMTQRSKLDAYLVEQAISAGAEFRDGSAVRDVDIGPFGSGPVTVRANGDALSARTLIGADGANGIVARAIGLKPAGEIAVALEGNIPSTNGLCETWQNAIALDFGGTPGGYGWLFPKGDHLNIGVGGWKWIGPSLRERVDRLCRALELDPSKLVGLRGHHLPMRRPGAPVARGPVLLVGDAAGLVDPLSGEGISAAFASGRLAAESVSRVLEGSSDTLSSYEQAVEREIMEDIAVSRKLQVIFQRLPRPCVAVMQRSDRFWRILTALVRGEVSYRDVRGKLGPARYGLDGAAWAVARFDSRRN